MSLKVLKGKITFPNLQADCSAQVIKSSNQATFTSDSTAIQYRFMLPVLHTGIKLALTLADDINDNSLVKKIG